MSVFVAKLFDLYTQKYLLVDPDDPNSVLTEQIENSLLEKILPPDAATKLSLADIEMGMDGEIVEGNHPDPENNVLLLNKGSRGLYGPPEYKALIEPFLDPTKDYPYHRYLSNDNKSLQTKDIKVWVIDDEEAISGIPEVASEQARVILGDSHGKVSYELGESLGDPTRLVQYRMLGVDTPFFSKGTFQAALQSTLDKHDLDQVAALEGIDMILPTSSIKGASKSNLPPGVHTLKVHLAAHKEGSDRQYTMRSVLEKFEGDPLSYALKKQTEEIAKINDTFSNKEKLLTAFVESLAPAKMPDPDNPGQEIDFDPERWQECGKVNYIVARQDLESGHYQLLESPIYTDYMKQFFASRARKAAELEFVKVNGAMIYCSHELNNDEICIPDLPEGETVAAIRSPIIKLQDIAVVKNRHIPDMYNDAGDLMQGAIICSPQAYDRIINGARNFVTEQTGMLAAAGVDVAELNALNAFDRYLSPLSLEGNQRQEFIEAMNVWREAYNDLVVANKVNAPQLEQIRQDTFAAILAADYDGDNIAVVPQSKYPELVAGIEAAIADSDNITEKLDKIKLEDSRETLGSVLARKADPFILGKTANLAANLQSYAVEATRMRKLATQAQKLEYLQKIAPAFYYVLGQPTVAERENAEQEQLIPTFRDYIIASTESRAIDPEIVARFDLYNLNRELPNILATNELSEPDLDRALVLWHDLLLNINDKVSQQNQIAVDNFKSERQVDAAFVEGISRRFRYLNDGVKRALDTNTTYYSEVPQLHNTTTNRSLLVENINRNLVSFGIEATPYSRIEHLFPKVEDLAINQQVASVVAQYKSLYKLSRLYRDKQRLDSGPSLIFEHQGNKIEITNILSQDHTPESLRQQAESGGLSVKLVKSSKPNASHQYMAMYRQGQDWKPLGTLCNACGTLNNIRDEIDFGRISKFDFVTPVGTHQAEAYNAAAKQVAENFRASISTEERDTYAAATYGFLVKTGNQSNNLGFMFAAFGDEMIRASQEFKLKTIRLNSLTGATIPTEKSSLLFEPDDTDKSKQAVYVLDGEQNKTKLGLVDHDYFHMRSGTTLGATINYTPPSVGVFTLADGQEFTIGGMAKAEASGEIFNDQELELELAMAEPITTPVFKLDGKVIGSMNERTANFLQSQGDLVKGKQLQVKLTSEGSGFARKIKAVAPNGDLFEIVNNFKIGHSSNKNRGFSEENAVITVDFQTSKRQLAAFAIRDGERIRLGEFNRNHRASQVKVESLGLVGKRFTARLKNNVTTLDLAIDPDTIVYPETSVNLAADNRELVGNEVNPTTAAFLDQMLQFEPIMHFKDRVYRDQAGVILIVNSLDLLVDSTTRDRHQHLLTELGFQKLAVNDPSISLESRKGFTVYTLPARNLSAENFSRLQRELKITRVFDERISDTAQSKFTDLLEQRYSNLKLQGVDPAEVVELPVFDDSVASSTSQFDVSSNILHLLAVENPSRDLLLNLNRYDYGWLNAQLNPATIIASPADVQNYLANPVNLARARELVKGYLTADEALVYQHLTAGTDLRYQAELATIADRESIDKIKGIIAEGLIPAYIPDGGLSRQISPLITKRQAAAVPLPDNLSPGVAVGIVLGNPQNDLSLALGDPQNQEIKDLERPVEFEGVNYPSVQAALSTLRNQQGFEATRDLPEKLLTAKLVQYPELLTQIESKGGKRWLYQNYYLDPQNKFMSGTGRNSGLVRATVAAYETASKVVALKQQQAQLDQNDSVISSYLTKEMFVENQTIAPSTVISNWTSGDALAAALSMATANAKYRQNVEEDYALSFRGNPERLPNRNLKVEKYFKHKPLGEPYVSAEDAYQHFAVGLDPQQKYQLMVELLTAKLEQHPDLVIGIAQRGGTAWLATCSYRDPNNDSLWAGAGNNSGFIKALSQAYAVCRDRTLGVESTAVAVESEAAVATPVYNRDETVRIVVAGSREFNDYNLLQQKLDAYVAPLIQQGKAIKIVSGTARGADHLGEKYAEARGYQLARFPAEWDKHGKRAGYLRNEEMASYANAAVIFWDGESKGTKHMIDLCAKFNLSAEVVNYQNLVQPALPLTGKPIGMNFPLMMQGRENPLPVDNCFDAMRGYGRTHTTRNFNLYQAYQVKEGDLAVVNNGDRSLVVRVGQQYQITSAMVNDPQYQQQWAEVEKHAPETLPKLFAQKLGQGKQVWGMHFEPLGDLVNGKLLDFKTGQEIELKSSVSSVVQQSSSGVIRGVNIASNSKDPFAAALTNPTENAKYKKSITRSYPISFWGNPYRPANTSHKAEKYFKDKPPGEPFLSAEDAYQHFKVGLNDREKFQLMVEVLIAKLEQYPRLLAEITKRGGLEFLAASSHQVYGNDQFWEGQGMDSRFVKALSSAYESVLTAQVTSNSNSDISALPGVQLNTDDVLKAKDAQDLSRSIQHLGTLDEATQSAIVEHLNAMKGELNSDVSQYAKGRQNFWLGTQWNLKDKQFQSSGVWNSKLWELCQRVYPDADMALITYSGDQAPVGIDLHRDDSYAAFEARSISLETVPGQETKWQFQQRYPAMGWVKQQNAEAPVVEFSLPSGSMTAFNCKNPHAATPGSGRWSINLWQVSAKQRDNYQAHLAKHGLDGGCPDLATDLPDIPLPAPISLTPEQRASLSAPQLLDSVVVEDITSELEGGVPPLPLEIQQMMVHPPLEPAVSDPSLLAGDGTFAVEPQVKAEVKQNGPQDSVGGFISVPGVAAAASVSEALQSSASAEHHNLKQVVSSIFEDSTVQIDTSLRLWQGKSEGDRAADSFIATFNDGSPETIAYNAAKVGTELNQSRMNYFIESSSGSDLMHVLDVPHTDFSEIRDTLELIGLSSYTLVPQRDSTRIILSDRGAKQPAEVIALAKHYHQQLQTYAGTFQSLTREQYSATIRAYEASHRDASSKRSFQINDHRGHLQGDYPGGRPKPSPVTTVAQRVASFEQLNLSPVLTKLAGKASKLIAAGPKLDVLHQVWGNNDLVNLSADDKILITGPTIEEFPRTDLKQLFAEYYQPRLDQVIAAKAKVLLTNNSGVDRLVSKYLVQQGYALKDSNKGYLQAWAKVEQQDNLAAQDLLQTVIPSNTMQQQRVDEAAPTIIQLINSTYSKTQFDTGKYLLNYDGASRELTMTDKQSGDLLLTATYSVENRTYITNSSALTLTNTAIGELKDTLDQKMSVPNVPQPALVNRFAVENSNSSVRESYTVNSQDFQR